MLFPALRLSYLVVPAASVDLFARGRPALERKPPVMEQIVLTEFFNEGHFARHLRRKNGIYQERQATLIEAVRQKIAGKTGTAMILSFSTLQEVDTNGMALLSGIHIHNVI